jgi:2-polyprenyl-3-methyl-5-hydroxy-6-metoxy-1,4-benzoquinol methylase
MRREEYDRCRKLFNFLLKVNVPFLGDYLQKKIYDKYFYEDANDLKKKSSQQFAEIIVSFFDFQNIFDIGCGCALYIEEFHRLGKEVLGCDGSLEAVKLASEDFTVFQYDVTKPLWLNRTFDLILCIEVAEHIHRKSSLQLIDNCTNSGNRVIFTAAPPGQGGVGHINERPREFWIKLFERNGFFYEKKLSAEVRKMMKQHNVVEWITNNLMSFQKKG